MTAASAESHQVGQPTVLISGTFDVGNYGDLLFPVVAQHRLGRLGYRVVPVSPTAGATVFADAPRARALAEILHEVPRCDAILIGGGDIIHAWRADFLPEYQHDELLHSAYLALWFGASVMAAHIDVPIIWNAPGIPSAFPEAARRLLLQPAVAAADYVAVRDAASARTLKLSSDEDVSVVPDTVAELARIWPHASLSETFSELARRKHISADERLLCVHIRAGGRGRGAVADLAAELERFSAAQALVPLLLSISPSLGDRNCLRELSGCLKRRHVLVDDPIGLREVAAAIAGSRAYVGNSLHGYITAASYGVPGVIVARPAFRKFAGFAAQLGREADVARDWDAALTRLASTPATSAAPRIGTPILNRLECHWKNVAAAIARPHARRAERAALLRHSRTGPVRERYRFRPGQQPLPVPQSE